MLTLREYGDRPVAAVSATKTMKVNVIVELDIHSVSLAGESRRGTPRT